MTDKVNGELANRIRYDVEHDLFHPQNVFSDEYITPTFVEYVRKLEVQIEYMKACLEKWFNYENERDYELNVDELLTETRQLLEKECE